MKQITFCRCGYSGGEHPRTAQCSEGRGTVTVTGDATAEQVQNAIKWALAAELEKGAAGFATNGGEQP